MSEEEKGRTYNTSGLHKTWVHAKHSPLALKLEAKRMYVNGEGTYADVSRVLDIPLPTIKTWAFDGKWSQLRDQWIAEKEAAMIPKPLPPLFEGPTLQELRYNREKFLREHIAKYFEHCDDLEKIMATLAERIPTCEDKDVARLAMAFCEVMLTKAKVLRLPITGYENKKEEQAALPQIDEARPEVIETEPIEETGEPTE